MPANTVSVCRPGRWGNPFPIGKPAEDVPMEFRGQIARDAKHAVELYRSLIRHFGFPIQCDLEELRGKNLACWCPLDQPCHADALLYWANAKGHRPDDDNT